MSTLRVWIAIAAAILFSISAFAQTPTGAIEGVVSDTTGAVVPGANVTVSDASAGISIPLVTNSVGFYSARSLLPGTYKVKVEARGFSIQELNNVVVNSGSVVSANMTLEVGKTTDVVQVSAEAVMVDTARQTVDSVITGQEVKNLPTFTRNFMDLATLAPGVFSQDGGYNDPTKTFAYRAVSIVGSSGTGTRTQIDGIDVTDETVGMTTSSISNEAVQQFQITRSSLDMSTSLTSTGAVNILTKSGTNDFHGGGFFDFYNQDLGARPNYVETAPSFDRKRFAASLGGPIVKDKLFFYGNFERTYQNTIETVRNSLWPQLDVDQQMPAGLRYSMGRADWNVTSSMRLFAKFQHNWDISTGGGALSPFQNVDWTNAQMVGFDYATPHTAHALRFGYNKFHNRIESQELTRKFNVAPGGTPYYLSVGTYALGPNSLAPQATYQTNYQISYDGSYIWRNHTFRYGGGWTHIDLGGFANFAGPLSLYGSYSTDIVSQIQAAGEDVTDPLNYPFSGFSMGPQNGFFSLKAGQGLPHGDHINNRADWFAGDNIKIARRLTINLGLRWEYDSGYFANDHRVIRDPNLELWGKGYSQFPNPPKNLFSPSFGFAWDPKGSGRTSIRGGFYKAYEANIYNNIMFDEYAMLPPGIGPDFYDETGVTGPDGTPINIDGKHPDGNYQDWYGIPIGQLTGQIGQINAALQNAYKNYQFSPHGTSYFDIAKGVTYGYQLPGNQFKAPYALQFNIGAQHEIRPGTVIAADYIYNHGIGLPFMGVDFEHRQAANTLNVDNARGQLDSVLNGLTVAQYMAANPGATIADFGMVNDNTFQGLYPGWRRARLFQGGFTKYRALQISLRGKSGQWRGFGLPSYSVSYALGSAESSAVSGRAEFLTGPYDNFHPNSRQTFGPTGLDYRHILTVAAFAHLPGGIELNSLWRYRSPSAATIIVPNFAAATSGSSQFFSTDLNGDGGTGGGAARGDVLPGVDGGQFGRGVSSISQLNKIITEFNNTYAGKLTPHGQALVNAGLFTQEQMVALGAVIPTIPLVPGGIPNPWHSLFTTDIRLQRPFRFFRDGRISITPFFDAYNLFNHSPFAGYTGVGADLLNGTFGALNFDYANGGAGSGPSDLRYTNGRLNTTRQLEVGIRVDF